MTCGQLRRPEFSECALFESTDKHTFYFPITPVDFCPKFVKITGIFGKPSSRSRSVSQQYVTVPHGQLKLAVWCGHANSAPIRLALDQNSFQEPPRQYPRPSCSRQACFSPSFHFQSLGWTVTPNSGW